MKLADPFVIEPPADLLDQQPQLKSLSSSLSDGYGHNQPIPPEFLQSVGEALWQAVDCETDFNAAAKKARQSILPVVIKSDIPAIVQLPWETLYHPKYQHLALSRSFTLSRQLEAIEESLELEKGPLRVLLFTSLPDYPEHELSKQQRLNIEEEQARVTEALLPFMQQGKVELESPRRWPV